MSGIQAGEGHAELVMRLDNTRPVEVTDLVGRTLQALGKQYEEFVVLQGHDHTPANAQLFVIHVDSGSIVVTLQTLLDQTSFLVRHIDLQNVKANDTHS